MERGRTQISPAHIGRRWLTKRQVAEKLGVQPKTVQRRVRDKKIPHSRAVGPLRFPEDIIDQWMKCPELVADHWFAGSEVATDHGEVDVSKETEGEALGRALFLRRHGR